MSDQLYQQRIQGQGVHMLISISAQAAQFILAKDVGDGPIEGHAITLDRAGLDHLRLWLGMAAQNTTPPQEPTPMEPTPLDVLTGSEGAAMVPAAT